ncbi:hypothetical protein [Sphaerotilus sp.]|uniref:hypothetical protein n=1 Tax=Sphaerotilus sp. TaxID=2093942 RepID=UPI002ACD8BFF|nr:hypothetical protein [Sphaerotilus sp.]MDZ7855922.1 hypothetical protein [Sphaerotilus sp.]
MKATARTAAVRGTADKAAKPDHVAGKLAALKLRPMIRDRLLAAMGLRVIGKGAGRNRAEALLAVRLTRQAKQRLRGQD